MKYVIVLRPIFLMNMGHVRSKLCHIIFNIMVTSYEENFC